MNKIESIHVAPTTERKAEPGRFENALRNAASGLARGVAATVELATPYVPGATVLSGAIRSTVQGPSAATAGAATASDTTGASTGEGDILAATRSLQQEARTFNLQYLQLHKGIRPLGASGEVDFRP